MWKYGLAGLAGVALGLAGAFAILGSAVGAGAGVGVATGLSAGFCGMAQAAQDLGVMDAAETDRVMQHAVTLLGEDLSADAPAAGSGSEDCAQVLARLRENA